MDLDVKELEEGELTSARIAAAKVALDLVETSVCWFLVFLATIVVLLLYGLFLFPVLKAMRSTVLWLDGGETALMNEAKFKAYRFGRLMLGHNE